MPNENADIAPVQKRRPGRPPKVATPQRAAQRVRPSGRVTPTGRVAMSNDIYHVDPEEIPEGMTLQWVTRTVMGKDDGQVRMQWTSMMRNGWTPVDGSRFPRYGITSGEIDLGGLVLCERPIEMTQEARQEDYDRAVGQVRSQMDRLNDVPADQLPRDNRGQSMVSVKRDAPIRVTSDADYAYEE